MYRDNSKIINKLTTKIFIVVFLLCGIGLVAIYSASSNSEVPFFQRAVGRQIIWMVLGLLIVFIMYVIKKEFIFNVSYWLYGAGLILVILPYLFPSSGGAHRWLTMGGFSYQPSEIMKILLVLAIAKYFTTTEFSHSEFKVLVIPLILTIIPTLIVLNQPDLGTAMIYVLTLFPIMIWAKVDLVNIFILVSPIISILTAFNFYTFFIWLIIIIGVLYLKKIKHWHFILIIIINLALGTVSPYLWNNLRPYQQQRIITLFDVKSDPQGAGYQVIQSQVAIGSGGAFGKGFCQGKQTHLKFLPEQKTDFIFSVIGEEWGFVGVSFVLLLYFLLIYLSIKAAYRVREQFNSLVIIGLTGILFFHTVINIAMTVGLMPVTGLPLPFLSYGGSFLTSCFIIIALIFNMNRELEEFDL
ncbi:MAG: rod shape-determining protein RodA [Candidatus Marinimicrobia bacterium]|nr:rod shape-determining protein RodA [Candidatus Neomarinimicrobiota bacterium]